MVPYVTLEWKSLGEVLLDRDILAKNPLEIINKNNPQNMNECCKQMFMKWLNTDKDASWRKLIAALEYPSVELNYLAEQIKGILQKGNTTNRIISIDNLLIITYVQGVYVAKILLNTFSIKFCK